MITYLSRKGELSAKEEKIFESACKKVKLSKDEVSLVSFDKMFFSYIYVLVVANKKLYLYDSENKKNILECDIREFDNISIQKKVDLYLYLKGGRAINLTSVVGVKPKVMNIVRELNSEINSLK